MGAGILERVGFLKYPMTPRTSTVWPWGIVWACGVISMRRMYNNLQAYTNYKSKDKWTQKRRQTLCNLNEACGKYESLWSPQLFPTEEHYKPLLRRMRSIMKSIPKSWNCFTVCIFQGFDCCVNVLNMCWFKTLKNLSTNPFGLNSRCNPIRTVMFEVSWPAWTLDGTRWDDRAERHQGHLLPLTTSPLIIFIMQVKKWMETMCSLLWWWRGLFLSPYFSPSFSVVLLEGFDL